MWIKVCFTPWSKEENAVATTIQLSLNFPYRPLMSQQLKRFINDFVVKTEVPIKAKNVQEMIFKDYSIQIPIGRIILIMKEDLNLTYK